MELKNKDLWGKLKKTASEVSEKVVELKEDIEQKQIDRKQNLAEKKKQNNLGKYLPIFEDDLCQDDFKKMRLIRFVNFDQRMETDECKGSIGFHIKTKERIIPTFYSKYASLFDFTYYPQFSESIFIADPYVDGKYIEIGEYYNYMKQVRINELTTIAQSLGAKHIFIGYSTTFNSSKSQTVNADTSGEMVKKVKLGGGHFEKETAVHSENSQTVWADTYFQTSILKNNPEMPSPVYFKNESDITSLIQMALDKKSKLTKRTYFLQASSSSGLSLIEGGSISATIKGITGDIGGQFQTQVETEYHSVLEYTIEF